MVHTATLSYMCSVHEYGLFKAFVEHDNTIYMKQNKKWYNGKFKDQGMNFWCYKVGGDTRGLIVFILRINFIRLIEKKDKVTVMSEKDTEKIEEKFNDIMMNFIDGMPLFRQWKVNRIDYCVNIKTPYVKEYIELLQKSDIPSNMKMIPNEHGNYAFRPGSYYVVSKGRDRRRRTTGSITINFYDKQEELLNQRANNEDLDITDEIIDQAKDILRLEVQCHKPKTDYLKVKYGMSAKNIHHFLKADVGYEVLNRAILQVCGGYGDFQRMLAACKIIDSLKCQNTKKDRLKRLLLDVSNRSTVAKVKHKYVSSGYMTKDTFRSYIKLLNENNVNAVTLHRNMKLQGKTTKDSLDSLWTLFDDAYTNEYAQSFEEYDLFDIDEFADSIEFEEEC